MTPPLLTTAGLLLSTALLATGCGGGGGDTMRATLTDDGCTYEGDTTPAPGIFDIEVENKTSHLAIFNLWALADGKSVEDVEHALEQARPAFEQGREPKPGTFDGLFGRGGWRTVTNRGATNNLPANELSGRFVIACFVHTSDGPLATDNLPPPAAAHVVPVELEVG